MKPVETIFQIRIVIARDLTILFVTAVPKIMNVFSLIVKNLNMFNQGQIFRFRDGLWS